MKSEGLRPELVQDRDDPRREHDDMDESRLIELLEGIRDGRTAIADAVDRLRALPVRDLGHTRLDTQRELRCGHPEVVFGAGKTPRQLVDVARAIVAAHDRVLVTRVGPEGALALCQELENARHDAEARLVSVSPDDAEQHGLVVVASAGTSDRAVAREAALTARWLGARVEELHDVGVAGLHRLLAHEDLLRRARALVVVAGMEGALASVVGGLVSVPVVAVPTSVGYGAAFEGLAALLTMLNSCAAGVSVVNIDNGFGAGYTAAMINRLQEVPRT